MIALLNEFIKPGSKRGEPPVIDPLPIVRHVVLMHQRITTVRTPIGYHGPRELPHVRMSPVELTQVLLNLIGNATQAVQARGEPDKKVAIEARMQGTMLELKVRDEGVGMAPDVLKKHRELPAPRWRRGRASAYRERAGRRHDRHALAADRRIARRRLMRQKC
jgi:C4-dicarboxylate-specific signal transduction histidine kinase